jgi:hypothetical protein
MKQKTIFAALVLLMTSAAHANECNEGGRRTTNREAHSACVAVMLGTILGAEAACGLKFDGEAIRTFITNEIHDDVPFISRLEAVTHGRKMETEAMSKSLLAAHCVIVRRFAEHEGFLPPAK